LKLSPIIASGREARVNNLKKRRDELAVVYGNCRAVENDWSPASPSADNARKHFLAGFDSAIAECVSMLEQMAGALEKINAMNYQTAIDQYGDKNKAESWACVRVANEALADYRKWKGEV
jgi:hypothetical protein